MINPRELQLNTGEYYKLVINNPSSVSHNVSAPAFSATVRNSKVDTNGSQVLATHVYPRARVTLGPRALTGYQVREIELLPGGTAEWYVTPVIPGEYDVDCGIPGHKKAGMTSRIVVN